MRWIDPIVLSCAVVIVGGFMACGCSSASFDVADPLVEATEDPGATDDADPIADTDVEVDSDVADTRRTLHPDVGETGASDDAGDPVDSEVTGGDSGGNDSGVDSGVDAGSDSTSTADVGCVPNVHHDGFGGTFLDCAPVGAWSEALARKAAHNVVPSTWSVIWSAGLDCGSGWGIVAESASCGCYATTQVTCTLDFWIYAGPFAGRVFKGTNQTGCTCSGTSTGWD